jgi:hypothetical protein
VHFFKRRGHLWVVNTEILTNKNKNMTKELRLRTSNEQEQPTAEMASYENEKEKLKITLSFSPGTPIEELIKFVKGFQSYLLIQS